jgi:hypothetical protein
MIKVYGASDDLVEVEGDIEEEFSYDGEKPGYLGFSDGTVLRISYDGVWHINLAIKGSSAFTHTPAEGEDTDNYSDVVTLDGAMKWVVFGEMAK